MSYPHCKISNSLISNHTVCPWWPKPKWTAPWHTSGSFPGRIASPPPQFSSWSCLVHFEQVVSSLSFCQGTYLRLIQAFIAKVWSRACCALLLDTSSVFGLAGDLKLCVCGSFKSDSQITTCQIIVKTFASWWNFHCWITEDEYCCLQWCCPTAGFHVVLAVCSFSCVTMICGQNYAFQVLLYPCVT